MRRVYKVAAAVAVAMPLVYSLAAAAPPNSVSTAAGTNARESQNDDYLRTLIKSTREATQLFRDAHSATGEMTERHIVIVFLFDHPVSPEASLQTYATAVVRKLVADGRDPTNPLKRVAVDVCARQDGLTTASGKPGLRSFGCARFDPYKDVVSYDPTAL